VVRGVPEKLRVLLKRLMPFDHGKRNFLG